MYPSTLQMLHYSRNKHICSVANSVYFQLAAAQIPVNKHGIVRILLERVLQILNKLCLVMRNLHTLTAQNIRRTDKKRISQIVRFLYPLLNRPNCSAFRALNIKLFQDSVKLLPVLRLVYLLRFCSENRNIHLVKEVSQFNCCLTAKLQYNSVRLLKLNYAVHILFCQRLKVKFIRCVKICADRFGVIIYNDSFKPQLFKSLNTMNTAIVKFYSLTNTDRTRTQHQHFSPVGRLRFVNLVIS